MRRFPSIGYSCEPDSASLVDPLNDAVCSDGSGFCSSDESQLRDAAALGVLRGELGAEAHSDNPHGDRSIDPGEPPVAVSPCDLRWCA